MDGCTAVVLLPGSHWQPNYTSIMRLGFPDFPSLVLVRYQWRNLRQACLEGSRVETLTWGHGCCEIGPGMVWIKYSTTGWGNEVRRGGPQGSGRIEGKALRIACKKMCIPGSLSL